MARAFSFDWVDAFTTETFGGNGCVVVHGADDIPEDQRMALVRETSLAECAYVVRSDVADFGARYFLAGKEILFAGHPTIATVASLADRGLITRERFTLEVGSGVITIDIDPSVQPPRITMTQAAPEFGDTYDPGRIADIYGLAADDIIHPPQVVSTGSPFVITLLRDQDALRRANPDMKKLAAFTAGATRADMMEPFLVTLGGATESGDTFSRLMLAPPSLPEDPFTGSATGCMAAFLWHHGLIESPRFTAEQGHWMGRPGSAECEVLGPPNAISGVRVAGQGTIVMRGELFL